MVHQRPALYHTLGDEVQSDVSGLSLSGKDVPLRELRHSKLSSDVDQI